MTLQMNFLKLNIILCLCTIGFVKAQDLSVEQMTFLTPLWEGARFEDGRPRVGDDILNRMKQVSIEEAWGVLRNEGYHNQFESGWEPLHPEVPMVGRALTVQYLPNRPDVAQQIIKKGKAEGAVGNTNSWPIDRLVEGDIYVADGFGKIVDGTLIGDNLGNAIYANSKNGVVFYGSVRDEQGLSEIDGFNGWIKGSDPSYIQGMMLTTINAPIRIGRAIVLPGDVVLANQYG